MFTGNMVTEATPARVFALYRIVVSKKNITRSELQGLMEPSGIYVGSSYFSTILNAATELKIVSIVNNCLVPTISKENLRTIEDFRKYVISKLCSFEDSQFYRCTNTIVNMNEKVYDHRYKSISDLEMLNYISSGSSNLQLNATMLRGWRFWAQFLGFGYMFNMTFLPNAYIFTKNVVFLMNLKKEAEYAIDDFMVRFNQYGKIITDNIQPEKKINIALSSALRELHDNGEITLKYKSDQESKWILYPSNELFNDHVASIVYKGVKR